MPNVFRVGYACGNCGGRWNEEYEKGDSVRVVFARGLPHGAYLTASDCTRLDSCTKCRYITCPICGQTDEVRALHRKPI